VLSSIQERLSRLSKVPNYFRKLQGFSKTVRSIPYSQTFRSGFRNFTFFKVPVNDLQLFYYKMVSKADKSKKKSAFVMFMEERRPTVEASGHKLTRGLAELSQLVNEDWRVRFCLIFTGLKMVLYLLLNSC